MNSILSQLADFPLGIRLVIFAGIAIGTHAFVLIVRFAGQRLTAKKSAPAYQKLRSIASLVTSALIFTLYFLTFGFILRELGVNITAYLASASVIALAVGFGSQGVVQDVVTGITFIFSDLIDIGDLVEISGQTGIVKSIGMRFTELENALGARVFVPNRIITNVINYPKGYINCVVDVTLSADAERAQKMKASTKKIVASIYEQFPAIFLTDPNIEELQQISSGKDFLRIKFRIWPNRGDPIEKTFRQEVTSANKQQDPEYQDWMIAIYYEVAKRLPKPVGRRIGIGLS